MTEDRAILHQAVAKKDFLAGSHILTGEQNSSIRVVDLRWDRRLVRIGAIGKDAEKRKSQQPHDHDGLEPDLSD